MILVFVQITKHLRLFFLPVSAKVVNFSRNTNLFLYNEIPYRAFIEEF